MARLTDEQSKQVAELWAQYEVLKGERDAIKWEISKMEAEWYELRCQMEHIAHCIEDIQGEIDWG